MSRAIDAHHHLWRYTPQEFPWLEGPLEPLRHDFLPPDLTVAMRAAAIDAAIAVEARQTLEETHFLLALARQNPTLCAVVGWAPLTAPNLPEILSTLLPNPHLKGIRHRVECEPDPGFILREDFNRGIATLTLTGLVFDILIAERHLPQTIQFVDRHPNQIFVLDHLAKPRVAEALLEPWATNLRTLARRPNVFCKLSGLVTEADPTAWTPAQLTPYLEVATEAFGPNRLLAASDWPVSLAGVPYPLWFQILHDFFAAFTPSEQAAIFGNNAASVYSVH